MQKQGSLGRGMNIPRQASQVVWTIAVKLPDTKYLVNELADIQRRVQDIHLSIQRQHKLIEDLYQAGKSITSAEIVLDSLQISLSLSVKDRYRLRNSLNIINCQLAS